VSLFTAARQHWTVTDICSTARPVPAPKVETPIALPVYRPAVGNLDPRLSEQQIVKLEPDSDSPPSILHSGPVLRHRPLASHLQYWGPDSRASSLSYTNPDYETASEYSEPPERRPRRTRQAATDSCAVEDDPADGAADSTLSESTKLKGVYWPGMDLFDSATPEMRRKRNQKKDNSVVEQLELNSQDVEATEIIFTPRGSFKRQRRISSSFYDDDEEGEVEHESPRRALARPALATMNPNITRRSRQPQRGQDHSHPTCNRYDEGSGRPGPGFGQGDQAPKRRRAFEVFQDEDISFGQPAKFKYLTAGYSCQLSPSPVPAFVSYQPLHDPFQFVDNKENVFAPMSQPTYGNLYNHSFPVYHPHPHAYAYGLGQDHPGSQYNNYMATAHPVYQQPQDVDDDQRTITAPPSPAAT
jgi:hypothetical protein